MTLQATAAAAAARGDAPSESDDGDDDDNGADGKEEKKVGCVAAAAVSPDSTPALYLGTAVSAAPTHCSTAAAAAFDGRRHRINRCALSRASICIHLHPSASICIPLHPVTSSSVVLHRWVVAVQEEVMRP